MLHDLMDEVFKALADRNRRRLLDRLREEPGLTLTELIDGLDMARQSASRHVAVLEEAGLVVTHWSGREKLHYLNPVPVVELAERWLDKFSASKALSLLALKSALEEEQQ